MISANFGLGEFGLAVRLADGVSGGRAVHLRCSSSLETSLSHIAERVWRLTHTKLVLGAFYKSNPFINCAAQIINS